MNGSLSTRRLSAPNTPSPTIAYSLLAVAAGGYALVALLVAVANARAMPEPYLRIDADGSGSSPSLAGSSPSQLTPVVRVHVVHYRGLPTALLRDLLLGRPAGHWHPRWRAALRDRTDRLRGLPRLLEYVLIR
jgi:hypothetical protein